jgi:isochorismate synthase
VIARIQLSGGLAHHEGGIADAGVTVDGDEGPLGTGALAFGSLPFNPESSSELAVCEVTITQLASGETWETRTLDAPDIDVLIANCELPSQETQVATSVTYQPSGEEYGHAVAMAVEQLRLGELDKVVLARSVRGSVDHPIDPAAVAHRLRRREPSCTIYALPLPDGRRFVGATPELLVARHDDTAMCHPLAGTIALPDNVDPNDYQNWLLGSSKNLREHAIVADEVTGLLQTFYADVSADPTPSIMALRTVAHLGTWIQAASPLAPVDVLTLLRSLHPTAAVGGLPRTNAYELLQSLERLDRGHYAGPVGWCDDEGNGEWWIGIRGVMIHESSFEAWAGAGIVSESDPIAEREETRNKLASTLAAVLVDRI